MARQPRCAVAGVPHLLALRLLPDVASQMSDADRDLQLRWLGVGVAGSQIALHAYCLGPDRTLLLLTPQEAAAPGRLVQDLGRRLAVDFNRRHGRSGPLFSGRFRSTVLEASTHLVAAMRFVEQMPMRVAGSDPATWRWSSGPGHTGAVRDPLITDHPVFWATGNTPFEREAHHRERLAEPLDEAMLARFDGALAGGWPIGDSTFLAAVAQKTARRLVPRTPGRPRKAEASLSPI